jgi:hypothetical protein
MDDLIRLKKDKSEKDQLTRTLHSIICQQHAAQSELEILLPGLPALELAEQKISALQELKSAQKEWLGWVDKWSSLEAKCAKAHSDHLKIKESLRQKLQEYGDKLLEAKVCPTCLTPISGDILQKCLQEI